MVENKKIELTENAVAKLREELAHLEGEGREKVINAIATARSHGDLSENAEYHAAREQQGMQEARIRQIRHMLENAEIITSDDDPTVKAGKVVTIRYEGDDSTETYLLGRREESRGDLDVLTPESNVGEALIGHRPGETVEAELPRGGIVKVEIVQVRAL